MFEATVRRVVSALLVLTFLSGLAFTVPFTTVRAAAPPAIQATPTPITTGVPRFEPAPCVYRLPNDQREGQTVTCGFAVVPERRGQAGGKTIRLPVAIYKSRGATPAPEPIVLLAGGPGQDSQVFADALTGQLYQALTANNDVVFFDQRGTGRAEPSLACDELGGPGLRRNRLLMQVLLAQPTIVDLAVLCRDRLVGQGIDLAGYTTTENAADVNDVRAVLGYARMNLLGASYGSELALAVQRDFPQFVRASAQVSIVPLQVPYYAEQTVNFDRSLTELFGACTADAACRVAYPDLRATFRATIATLNATPAIIQIQDPATGEVIRAALDGADFGLLLFQFLYVTPIIPFLPDLIGKVGQGDTAFLTAILTEILTDPSAEGGISLGMHFSVICTNDTSRGLLERTLAAQQAVLPEARAAVAQQDLLYFAVCPQWPSQGADPQAETPVTSDVPTLLLNGQFDPVTPPSYGAVAARTLRRGFNVDLPGGGHSAIFGPVPVTQCGTTIVLTFLATPERGPDASCTGRVGFTFRPLPQVGQPTPTPGTATPGTPTPGTATPVAGTPTPGTPAATPTRPAMTPPAPTVAPSPSPTTPMPGLPNTGSGAAASGGAGVMLTLLCAGFGLGALSVTALVRRRRRG